MASMSMSWYSSDSDDDRCGDEEGEEGPEMSLLGTVILTWVCWGFSINILLVILRIHQSSVIKPFLSGFLRKCDNWFCCSWRCLRSGCCSPIGQFCLQIVLCAYGGPFPLVIVICCGLWWCLQYLCGLPRRCAKRRTQRAVDRLRRFPDHRRWHSRGWLIMLRARHQRSLARSNGWPARLRKLECYNEANIIKYAMRNFMGDRSRPEIELLEAGRSRMNFVPAVMAVVEINEEGLLRHIISFL